MASTQSVSAGIRCRCSLCSKDLTEAVALLGFEVAREIHVTAHLRDDMLQFVDASRQALVALAGAGDPHYYAGMEKDAADALQRALARIGADARGPESALG